MTHEIRLPSCTGHEHVIRYNPEALDNATIEAFAALMCKYISGGILRKGEAVFFMSWLAKSVVEAETVL